MGRRLIVVGSLDSDACCVCCGLPPPPPLHPATTRDPAPCHAAGIGGACPADFDGNGTVAVTDIFAFLSAWFAQGPGSDFDGNGTVAVPDIFAFLSAWFAGCP